MLGHSQITTTRKYAHVLDADLRAGMERAQAQHSHRRTPAPATTAPDRAESHRNSHRAGNLKAAE